MAAVGLGVPSTADAVRAGAQQRLGAGARLPADFYPGGLRAGRPIPRGHVVVLRRVALRGGPARPESRLTCPSGHRMRSLATSRPQLGFLVVRADRRYVGRLRIVRMSLFAVDFRSSPPSHPGAARAAADRRPVMAGLCRRLGA